jgi:lycopene beta-cyclase/lycopene epsilon-cyclase
MNPHRTGEMTTDVLVLGGGPAALCIAAALSEEGLRVDLLSAQDPRTPWPNTYGIWCQEVERLGLAHLLSHRWEHSVSHFGAGGNDGGLREHGLAYGLLDRGRLQQHWLTALESAGQRCLIGKALGVEQQNGRLRVHCSADRQLGARLVVDATGHQPALISQRPAAAVAGQAAYGIVGTFQRPPIEPGTFVFMDFRCDHLSAEQRQQPPTFLYAMDLGAGRFFVEETSLALAPPVPYARLRQRLLQRLAHRGAEPIAIEHEEFCLFPMNPPLPSLPQAVAGFGGAAGMVHPASGYMVGSLLRRAPTMARAIASGINAGTLDSAALTRLAWQALWPAEERLKREFYRFGLSKLMGFDEARLRHHFAAFFALPEPLWFGFLTNTLGLSDLGSAMVRLFALAPWDVRAGLLLPAREAPGDG